MSPEMKKFWMGILSSSETNSSKRLITLIISLHFIIASFVILFFSFYIIIYTPKGVVNIALLNLLKTVLEYDFYIILSGLGFITSENLAQMLLERAKATATGLIGAVGAASTVNNSGDGGDSVTDIIESVAKSNAPVEKPADETTNKASDATSEEGS